MISRLRVTLVAMILVTGTCQQGRQSAHIDWVDLLVWNGIQYIAVPDKYLARTGTPALAEQVGTIKKKLSGHVTDPNYKVNDGDAAFLEAGTPIYAVVSYRPSFRLAAQASGLLRLYEADTNPRAHWGADLLDIKGRVTYIGLNSDLDGVTELGSIRDPDSVAALVEMVANGSVDQRQMHAVGTRYMVDFHMADGTQVVRPYWIGSGEMNRGIHLPQAFANAVSAAVGALSVVVDHLAQ